ncbi:MAG: cytochrome c maturation protein CcmE [Nitrospinaceae bacterium]
MGHKKTKFVVGSLLIVAAIGYLISTTISNTSQFFLTVDELAAAGTQYHGAGLKVKGKVVQGSINRNPDDYLQVSFSIEENNAKLPVIFQGVTPDMFEDGREVVVEGTVDATGVFHANTLLTSCPSKYEAEREAGKMHPGNIPLDGKPKPGLDRPDYSPKTAI